MHENYSDIINAHKIKKNQLLIHEFCLISLNNAATSLNTEPYAKSEEHSALAVVLVSARLLIETVSLLQTLGFPEKFEKRLSQNCKIAQQVLEILEEISTELSNSLILHKEGYNKYSSVEDISFHRLTYILTLSAAVAFREVVVYDPCKRKLDEMLKLSILDSTLYLTHENLHKRIATLFARSTQEIKQLQLFDYAKEMMKSMAKCIKLLRDSDSLNQKQLLRACHSALASYEWHEYTTIVALSLKICRQIKLKDREEIEKETLSKTVLDILQNHDNRIRTAGYLEFHNLVQDVLGIARALDIDGSKKHDLEFILQSPNILKEIIQNGCMNDGSDHKHIRQAAKEIVAYFLKGRPVLGETLWTVFVENIFKPNCVILNCLIDCDSIDKENKEISLYLSKKLLSIFSPTMSDTTVELITDPIIDNIELLRSNIRLMFHKSQEIRIRANTNIKAMLSQESNSYDKLPRFSDIIQTNLSDSTRYVFSSEFNRIIDLEHNSSSLPQLSLRTCAPEGENLSTLCKVLDILCRPIIENSDTRENDIQLRRAAVSRLEILLQDKDVQQSFQKENKGTSLLISLLSKCISETNYDFEPKHFIPSLAKCLLTLAIHNETARNTFYEDKEFLFGCLRCLYIFYNDNGIIADLRNLLIIVLFQGFIDLKINKATGSEQTAGMYAAGIISKKFYLPFQHFVRDPTNERTDGIRDNIEIDSLLKTFWNLAWYGNASELKGMATTRVNRDTTKNDSRSDKPIIPSKLELSDRELAIIQISDVLCCSSSSFDKMKTAKDHSDFLYQMQAFLVSTSVPSNLDSIQRSLNLDWKSTLERFFINRPTTIEDEKLFSSILNFISQYVAKLVQLLDKTAETNANNFQTFVTSVLRDGAMNISNFINRTTSDSWQRDFRDAEMYHNISVKGNENAGNFMLQLMDFDTSDCIPEVKKDLVSCLIESFIQSSSEAASHCHWPIKVIASFLATSSSYADHIGLSKTSKTISKCINLILKLQNQNRVNVILGSSITRHASIAIHSMLKTFSHESEKIKRIILESFQVNGKTSWLFDILWQNRSPFVRTVGLSIGSVLSLSSSGADFLTCSRMSNEAFWLKIASIFLDRTECPNARSESINIMINLLKLSAEDKKYWYGPTFVEPVSKMVLDGEGALYNFFDHTRLDREISDIYRTFSTIHTLNKFQSERFRENGYHKSLSYAENIESNDLSINSTDAMSLSKTNLIWMESSINPNLITTLHKLLNVILTLESEASADIINEINDCSLLPNFESEILPAISGLCIDISDPYTQMTIQEMVLSNNGDNENDLVDMTIEHLNLLTLSLKRQNNIHRSVTEAPVNNSIAKLLSENDCVCQSMLFNTVYCLFTKPAFTEVQKIELVSAWSQEISTWLQSFRAMAKVLKPEASRHVHFISKYMTGLLDMSNFVLASNKTSNCTVETIRFHYIPVTNILTFISEYFNHINIANDNGDVTAHICLQKNQVLLEKLCNSLLHLHRMMRGSTGTKYDIRQKKILSTGIYMSLQELLILSSEARMIVMYEETKNIMRSSLLQDTVDKLSLIAERFKAAHNSR